MKKINSIVSIILLVLISTNNLSASNNYSRDNEKVLLITDRNIYVCGETIHFTSVLIPNKLHSHDSKVLYVELITPNGINISQKKIELKNNKANGSFNIPRDISSSYYYVKAYTKFMRNYTPNQYHYTAVKIINPDHDEILPYQISDDDVKLDSTEVVSPFKMDKKQTYEKNQTVDLSIQYTGDLKKFYTVGLSIIPEHTYASHHTSKEQITYDNNKTVYFPETRGLAISGKVVNAVTSKDLSYSTVNLSIIGENRDFMAQACDSMGRFNFSLPKLAGQHNILLTTYGNGEYNNKIMVFNDYCSRNVSIKAPHFKLSEKERDVVYNMAVNREVETYFNDLAEEADTLINFKTPFYGEVDNTFYIDDYIDLPTLEDCIKELPFQLRVIKRKKRKYIILDKENTSYYIYDPIVLVDMVAITDFDKILEVPAKRISHIDIDYDLYTKGNITYGGIISIFSNNNDYCGISLPESGIFLNYDFYSEDQNQYQTNSETYKYPDSRNTLYWNPILQFENNQADISFKTPDYSGKFQVLIQGITTEGEVVSFTETIEVE